LRYTYFCNELINVLTNGGGYERNFRRIYRAKKNRAVRKKNDSFVYCFCGFGSGFIFGGVMKKYKEYSVLFQFKRYPIDENVTVTVFWGETIEQAIQKKYQTKKQPIIISSILLSEGFIT